MNDFCRERRFARNYEGVKLSVNFTIFLIIISSYWKHLFAEYRLDKSVISI